MARVLTLIRVIDLARIQTDTTTVSDQGASMKRAAPKTDHVPVHAPNCNDYSGCRDGCRSLPREQAVYRAGAWRAIASK